MERGIFLAKTLIAKQHRNFWHDASCQRLGDECTILCDQDRHDVSCQRLGDECTILRVLPKDIFVSVLQDT